MYNLYDRTEQRVGQVVELAVPSEYRAALASEYQKRYRDAFAPKTIRNLEATKRLFASWCAECGYDPKPPVSPIVLAEYVEYLGGKVKAHTIKNRLWGIGEMHRAEFYPSPSRHRLVLMAFRAVHRKYGSAIGQASPLCKPEVLRILGSLGTSKVELRDKALLYTASDSWCRASELVSLRVRDFSEQEDGSSSIFLERSKTDPYGRGEYAFLSASGAKAVNAWVTYRGLEPDDHVFIRTKPPGTKTALHPTTVSRIFKRLAGRETVSAHSTRIGGVHDALRLGCDLGSIMIAGRWSSPEMPAVYGRKIMASKSAAALVSHAHEVT